VNAASSLERGSEYVLLQPQSVEAEAISRLRLVTAVSALVEIILVAGEAMFFPQPDWMAVKIQLLWLVVILVLLAVTWHPRFRLIWKPALLLFATVLILSTGILSTKGTSSAPFMFMLVLLPVGGTILPWDPSWQAGMSSICLLLALLFSGQFDWRNHLAISGLSAMVAAILGSQFVTVVLTRQRRSINAYLQALTRSEEKFRKIFEMSGSLIAIYTIPDGSILDVNPAWEKTFGYSREETLGRSPTDLGMTQDRGDFVRWASSLKTGDAGVEHFPIALRGRSNLVHCVYSWTTFKLDGRDCVLLVGQDITERIQVEEELRRNREVMLNQERLKAVGELASGIAHDLNNSLNALQLWVEVLNTDLNVVSQHSDKLQLISRIVRDAGATIGRLQDFARCRHDRPSESVDLAAIIAQSVQMVKSTLEEKNLLLGKLIRVEVEVPELALVLGEPSELRQMFLNLLLNAQDAMPAGGSVRITGRVELEAITVSVEDEGHGIPPEHLNRIFDPFFSTKGERGTGLGLSIAYAVMARIGGTISAANRVEGGAVFTLSFPLVHQKPISHAQNISAASRPLRIMVMDDDQNNRQAFSALLESRGHSVISASSGPEALEKLTENNLFVDVIFCDLGMPLMNGWEVARRVKSLEAPPAFYLVTGWAAEIPAEHPHRHLIDGVIAKPVHSTTVDDFLARHKAGAFRPASPTEEDNNPLVNGNRLMEH
jgi:PAS domain S-box-containing protein